ncbi:MAG: AraC family transcriptional regulator [Bacteroidaceae bacterium]|nr:AraC family transcriptional regulator [Bacteroidaceae bacterium]
MEEETKPYKIKAKGEKNADYRNLIRAELADELYDRILTIVVAQKKYRDPQYSAKQLAKDLDTNPRYLSAVINSRFGMNYSNLVNGCRIRDAVHMLVDRRYLDKTMEEIGKMCGFANRQSFYAAFFREKGEAPHQYKKRHLPK